MKSHSRAQCRREACKSRKELIKWKWSGTATFYQGKKEIGKVTVRSEEVGKKIEVTRVGVSGDKLTSIELGGTKTKLNIAE